MDDSELQWRKATLGQLSQVNVLRRRSRLSMTSANFRGWRTLDPPEFQDASRGSKERPSIHMRDMRRHASLPTFALGAAPLAMRSSSKDAQPPMPQMQLEQATVPWGPLGPGRNGAQDAMPRGHAGLQQLGAFAAQPPARSSSGSKQAPVVPSMTPDVSGVSVTPIKQTVHDERTKLLRGLSGKSGVPFDVIQHAAEHWEKYASLTMHQELIDVPGSTKEANLTEIFQDGVMDRRHLQEISGNASDSFAEGKKQQMTFAEFAVWLWSKGFSAEFCLSPRTLGCRKIAKNLDIPLNDLDKYKCAFDKFDADRSGFICHDEFEGMLTKLSKVPAGTEMPQSRVRNLWQLCDLDNNGKIDFEEFIIFYRKYFPEQGDDGNSPFEDFYTRAASGVAGFGGTY